MAKEKERAVLFASGSDDGGGTGSERLVRDTVYGSAGYKIVAIASTYPHGGVQKLAKRFGIPFIYSQHPQSASVYQSILKIHDAKWAILSGWRKFVVGLNPAHTINIHPAPLSFDKGRFGGLRLYGHRVHQAVAEALNKGELTHSGFTMHFVTDGGGDPVKAYDKGPIFAEIKIPLKKGMTAGEIEKAVKQVEHRWQSLLTNMVITGQIRLEEGKVVTPFFYGLLPKG